MFGCSYQSSDSFYLVCTGKLISESGGKKIESTEESIVTRTYKFQNKKIKNFDCSIWNDEVINCSNRSDENNKINMFKESIFIDRISAEINYSWISVSKNIELNDESRRSEKFNGKCEKLKNTKI
jgi:hypothetical protein